MPLNSSVSNSAYELGLEQQNGGSFVELQTICQATELTCPNS